MSVYVYYFRLVPDFGASPYQVAFPCYGHQEAWMQVATYVSCHVLNPPIKAVHFLGKRRIEQVSDKLADDEISSSDAFKLLQNPRIN